MLALIILILQILACIVLFGIACQIFGWLIAFLVSPLLRPPE